jgi:hypothetical protein
MPDEFEERYGFDAGDPTDGAMDADADGYTNVEEFLNAVRVPEPGPWVLQASALATVAALALRRNANRGHRAS